MVLNTGSPTSNCLFEKLFVKSIFYKNNAKPPIVTQNLHVSAPYFGACLPEIWGKDSANVE